MGVDGTKGPGLDFSFWNGRLAGTFGYYHKVTDGALLNLTPAPSSSYRRLFLILLKSEMRGWNSMYMEILFVKVILNGVEP